MSGSELMSHTFFKAVAAASWCGEERTICEPPCPVSGAENKLRAAHRYWHTCLDDYQSPREFQESLNSCIQELRNVTFALQASKENIPGFDSWYCSEQEQMRKNKILRWLVDARNTVCKQGDLEINSFSKFHLIGNYDDVARLVKAEQIGLDKIPDMESREDSGVEFRLNPFMSTDDIFNVLKEQDISIRIKAESILSIERRWIHNKIPNFELLDILGYSWGILRGVIVRCHELLGIRFYNLLITEAEESLPSDPELISELPSNGRLPCMIMSGNQRRTNFRILDGTEVELNSTRDIEIEFPSKDTIRKLENRYGQKSRAVDELIKLSKNKNNTNLEKRLYSMAVAAIQVIQSGEDHGFFSYYYCKDRLSKVDCHRVLDPQSKILISEQISRNAIKFNSDTVVIISEVWLSPFNNTMDGSFVPPSLHPSREEALSLLGITRAGEESSIKIRFQTLSGESPHRKIGILSIDKNTSGGMGITSALMSAWNIKKKKHPGESLFRKKS